MLDVGDPPINIHISTPMICTINSENVIMENKVRLDNNSTPTVSISYQELEDSDVICTLAPWFPDTTLDCLV